MSCYGALRADLVMLAKLSKETDLLSAPRSGLRRTCASTEVCLPTIVVCIRALHRARRQDLSSQWMNQLRNMYRQANLPVVDSLVMMGRERKLLIA